jgi:hypothetical protein
MITFCREIAELGMIECLRQELLKPQDKLKDETSLRVFFTSEKTRKIPYITGILLTMRDATRWVSFTFPQFVM